MTTSASGREQRRHQRYRVKENALALDHAVIGQILNLSRGGLMFRYLADLYDFKGTLAELDVYFAGDGLSMRRVPCRAVFNEAVENEMPFSSLSMRQCGVEFGELTLQQEAQLQHIIAHRTLGEV